MAAHNVVVENEKCLVVMRNLSFVTPLLRRLKWFFVGCNPPHIHKENFGGAVTRSQLDEI
jgi:hypothetical protein